MKWHKGIFSVSVLLTIFCLVGLSHSDNNMLSEKQKTSLEKDRLSLADSWGVDLVGQIAITGSPVQITISGDYAYVAAGNSGVHIVDISDPANPTTIAIYDSPNYARDVVVAGDYAYVADGSSLLVLDISDPANPVLVASSASAASSLALVGNLIFDASGCAGLRVYDVSDPANPALLGSYAYDCLYFDPTAVAVLGNYAYFLDFWGYLSIVDVTNPTDPAPVAYSYFNVESSDIAIYGNYAYIAKFNGMSVFDLSNPLSPVEIGMLEMPFCSGAAAFGEYAFMAMGNDGLAVIDITDPTNPMEVGRYVTGGSANHAECDGEYVYLVDYDYGLFILKPLAFEAKGLTLCPGPEGKDAHVSSWEPNTNFGDSEWYYGQGQPNVAAFIEFDLSDIPVGSDIITATISLWAEYRDGNIFFESVASMWDEQTVTWENKPATIPPAISYPISRGDVSGGCYWGCTRTFEISDIVQSWVDDPASNFGLSITAFTPGIGWLMASSDNQDHSRPKLSVLYVEKPAPISANLDFDPNTLNLRRRGRWVTCYIELPEPYRVEDIDLSTVSLNGAVLAETHPSEIGDADGDNIPDLMVKFDNEAVKGLLTVGIQIPVTVSGQLVSGEIFIAEDFIHVIQPVNNGSVLVSPQNITAGSVLNISWLAMQGPEDSPVYRGFVSTDGGKNWELIFDRLRNKNEYSWTVDVLPAREVMVLVETSFDGRVVQMDASRKFEVKAPDNNDGTTSKLPQSVEIHLAGPNPTNPAAMLEFSLTKALPVHLSIYDVRGRLIRSLLNETKPEGCHRIVWEGIDDGGRYVSSGIYFYLFEAGSYRKTGKITLVR